MVTNLGNLGTGPLGTSWLGGISVPGYDYHAEANRVRDILLTQNTTTATPWLSQDLSSTVQEVTVNDPERVGIQNRQLPALFIRCRVAEESFHSLGGSLSLAARSKKEKLITWEIFGLYPKEGWHQDNESFLENIHDFARNTEAVFQADARLTGASTGSICLWVNPKRTDFGDVVIDGDIVKGFRIDLEGLYLFK